MAKAVVIVLVSSLVAGAASWARAESNALCVTNADPDHGHRFLWMHSDYDFEIHSALAEPGQRVCFDSEFLAGPGWYLRAVVKLYEDRYQTAGQEFASQPVDFGPAEDAARREFCFRFDEAVFIYGFASGPCP